MVPNEQQANTTWFHTMAVEVIDCNDEKDKN